MNRTFAKKARVFLTAAVMTAVVAVSACAVKVTAIADTAVRARASSTSVQVTTMKKGTTRKVLRSTKTWYKVKVNGKTGYVKKKYTKVADDSVKPQPPEPIKNNIADAAKEQLGKEYKWGGSGPDQFDASGLCQYVYKICGKNIPRGTAAQYAAAAKIKMSDLKSGDLVFFKESADSDRLEFSAIYIGDDQIVTVSSSQKKVVTAKLSSKYYKTRFLSGGRF